MCQFWNTLVEYSWDTGSKVGSFVKYLLRHKDYPSPPLQLCLTDPLILNFFILHPPPPFATGGSNCVNSLLYSLEESRKLRLLISWVLILPLKNYCTSKMFLLSSHNNFCILLSSYVEGHVKKKIWSLYFMSLVGFQASKIWMLFLENLPWSKFWNNLWAEIIP